MSMHSCGTGHGKPLLVSVKEAERLLGVGHTKLYDLLGRGLLEVRKIDRKTLVLFASIERVAHAGTADAA